MYKQTTILAILFLITPILAFSGKQVSPNILKFNLEEPETVSYCELFNDRDKYLGKLVRTKVIWTYAPSLSYIRSAEDECGFDSHSVISFPTLSIKDHGKDNSCSKTTKEKFENLNKKFSNETEMTVVGRLYECGRCGHSDFYEYRFVVDCLEEAKSIKPKTP